MKAFTMIELVFVIVILGILAAVAIPKLVATRDDARTASLSTQIKSGTEELITYYTSKGGEVNFSNLDKSSQVVFNELIRKGWVGVINDRTCYLYDDRNLERVCLIYTTNGSQIEVEYNNSNNHTLCERIKAVVSERNYTVLGTNVEF